MRGITPVDERRIYYYVLWPMAFLSIHPDYLLVHRLVPHGPGPDDGRVRLAVRGARPSRRPGFDPSDAVAFWDLTNRQDWHVCELQQRGTRSSSWVAGRYSNQEASVHAFDQMVADRYAGESTWSQADRPRALRRRRRRSPATRALTAPMPSHRRGARTAARAKATAPR